jgi:hypothetical protein
VEVQRSPAEDPQNEADGDGCPADQSVRRRKKDERERSEDREQEDPALALLRNSASAKERRDRHGQPRQSACERNPGERCRSRRHPAFDELPVTAGERPEALADDDDAVGTGHAAEPGEELARIGTPKDLGRVHLHTVPERRPPGKGQAACSTSFEVLLPVTAREEAQQRENQNDDEDDPKNAQ